MSDGGRRGWRILAGLLLAARGRGRRREQERRRQEESAQALRAGEELVARSRVAATSPDREHRLGELAEELEQTHERVRRRRAEPPPTVQRKIVATRRAERVVLAGLGLAVAGALAFAVLYVAYPDTQLLGLAAGLAMVGLAVAAVTAGKRLVPQEKVVTEYHWYGDRESHEDVAEIVGEAGEGISRRRLLMGAAGAAGATGAAAAAFPLASLGPQVGERIAETPWTRGRRLVTPDGTPLRAEEVVEETMVYALPEGSDKRKQFGAPVNVLRIPLDQLELPPERKAKCPEGIVAYSRICTHAGCAVSMYRVPLFSPDEPDPALVCPCHYSTFDPRRGGAVQFGPAGRPLPQLPLRINAAGELEADGGFYEPIGPSYGRVRLQGGQDR